MNLPVNETAAWVVGVAATLAALGVVWRASSKLAKVIYLLETHWPTLAVIAEQFKKNGGNSLKDQIDRIEDMAKDARSKAYEAHSAASKVHDQMIRIDENVRTLVRTNTVVTPVVTAPA